jgi:hypothetical protein
MRLPLQHPGGTDRFDHRKGRPDEARHGPLRAIEEVLDGDGFDSIDRPDDARVVLDPFDRRAACTQLVDRRTATGVRQFQRLTAANDAQAGTGSIDMALDSKLSGSVRRGDHEDSGFRTSVLNGEYSSRVGRRRFGGISILLPALRLTSSDRTQPLCCVTGCRKTFSQIRAQKGVCSEQAAPSSISPETA